MTAPVTAAVPAARPAPASDSGGSDSAAPFASALDGALAAGRSEVDGTAGQDAGDAPADEDQAAADGTGAEAAGEPATPAPGGVVAALWALLTGAGAAAATDAPAEGSEVPGAGSPVKAGHGKVDGVPPGRAVALARAAGVAHGLHGTQPGKVADAVPAGATPATTPADAATPAPTDPTTTPAAAVPAAAQAALDALAAAGVEGITVEAGTDNALTTVAPTDGEAPATVPTATALPVAAADPSSGTGTGPDTGSGSGADSDAGAPASTDAVPSAAAAGPVAGTAPTARAEAATGTAVAAPVSGQLARHVAVLRHAPDGTHTMTVVLTPETLGPVEVSVTVSQGTVELTLRGAHEHGRAALIDALPDLRRDLEVAGLTCSRVDVDRGGRDGGWSASQQQSAGRFGEPGQGGRGPHQGRPDGDARPWQRSADRGEGRPATARSVSGLDIKV
jgi:flagellar hook-length control protein FliK